MQAVKILKQLLYYDIFDHPLDEKELTRYCSLDEEGKDILDNLVDKGYVHRLNGYFAVRSEEGLCEKRTAGQRRAEKEMPKAIKMGRRISAFPFVKSVSLSGSISKNYMDDDKDVDFFVVTTPKRLWLARTILILYKKTILRNSFRYFCLNYFLDEEHLVLEDENIFTATELATLIPLSGKEHIQDLYDKNPWVKKYYKIFPYYDLSGLEESKRPVVKKVSEFVLGGWLGNQLDLFSMKLTISYWKRKYKNYTSRIGNKSFRFERHTSKYHPGDFQSKVLEIFEEKTKAFEKKNNLKIEV